MGGFNGESADRGFSAFPSAWNIVVDRRIIGEDIKTVEFGWPVGIPVVRPLGVGDKLYEVRSVLTNGDESRIIFTLFKNLMIILHGFVKKTKKTRQHDLNLAKNRLRKFLQDAQT